MFRHHVCFQINAVVTKQLNPDANHKTGSMKLSGRPTHHSLGPYRIVETYKLRLNN